MKTKQFVPVALVIASLVVATRAQTSAITDPRLAQLDTAFKARLASDVQKPHDASLATLDEKYYAALSRAREVAKTAGKFEEVTALDAEKARIEKKEGLPPADVDDTPAALAALRATYRATAAKLAGDRDAKAILLYDAYLRAIDAHVIELTKADNIDAAKQAQEFRDRVALEKPVPAAPPAAAPSTPQPGTPMKKDDAKPVQIVTSSPWREVATWALSMDAELVQIRTPDGRQRDIKKADDLPSGKFEVTAIKIQKRAKELTDDGLTRVALAKDLRSFEIPWQDKGLQLTSLKPFRGLKKLESLTLHGLSSLGSGEYANLSECAALRVLDVRGSSFDDAAAAAIRPCVQLASLTSGGHKNLTDTGLRALAQMKGLTSLYFEYGHGFGDAGIAALGELPLLSSLTCWRVKGDITWGTLSALAPMRKLKKLVLDEVTLSPDGIAAIGKIASLESLRLAQCGINGDDQLAGLAGLTGLASLELDGVRVTGEGFAALGSSKGLTKLALPGAKSVTAAGLAMIAKTLPALEELNLSDGINASACPPADIAALASLKNLKSLSVSFDGMDDTWLVAIAKLSGIESLEMRTGLGCAVKVTPAGLSALAPMKRLARLNVSGSSLMDDTVIDSLKQLKSLRQFTALSGARITKAGREAIERAVPGLRVTL